MFEPVRTDVMMFSEVCNFFFLILDLLFCLGVGKHPSIRLQLLDIVAIWALC